MNKIFVTDPTVEELPLKYDAFQEIAKLNGFTELHDKITQRRRDIDKRLLMMVVGQGNFGKSTFINNFLQKEVAPVNFLPKTWKIDIYFPTKDKEYAEIFWKGKTVPEVVSIDKAKQICDQEEIKRSERKKENKSQKSDDIEEIQEVQWHLNIPSYTDEFCLVDTPGLGQQRDDTEIQSINLYGSKGIKLLSNDPFLKYYHRADLVLWCFRADKQNPKKTEEMLKKIGPYNKKIIGLITHMDKVPQDQWREVEQQIKGYFGSYVEEFLCIAGGNDIELQQSTYNKLRESLKAEILPQCEELKQESHINFYKKEALEFSSHLNNISTQYYHKNIQTMLTSIEYCNNQITKMHERTIQKLNQIIVDYFNDKVRQLEPIWNRAEASSSDTIQQFKLLLEQSLSDSSSLETRINSNIESEFKALESDINSYLNQESWTSLNLSREGKEVLNTPISISIKQLNGRVSSTNINQISGSEGDSEGIGFGAAGAAIGAFLLGPVGLLAAGVGFLAKAFFAKSKTIEKVTNSLSDANDKTQEQVIKMLCKMTDNFIDTSTAEIKLSHNQHVGRKTTDVTYLLGNFDHACHKLGTKYTEATPLSVLKNTAILSPHRFGVLQTILKFENLLNYEISVQDPLYEFSLLLSNWDKEQKKGVLNIVNNNKIKAEELINEMRVAIKNIVSEESAKKSLNLLTERINQLNSSNHKVINEIKSIQYAICPFLPSELLEELNEVHNSIRKIQNEAEQPLIELFCSKLNDLEIEELHLSHELIKKYSSDNKWLFSRHEEMITAQESITEKMMKDQIYNSCYIGHINDFSEAVKVRRIKRLDVIDRIELSLANHIKDNINKIISPMQEVTDPTQIITKLPELEFALNNLKTIKEKTSDFINQEILGAINNAHIVLEKMLRTAEIAL
ncbi:MAG: dynamin family protein, partial [Bacteriovoracaceae bacterium]|nr:dynamin family protein [Bacteriovoracaceae bacterium]